MRFMNKEEASRAILLFDGGAESKKITPKALIDFVVSFYFFVIK